MTEQIPAWAHYRMQVIVPNIQHGLDEVNGSDPDNDLLQKHVLEFIEETPEESFEQPTLMVGSLVKYLEKLGAEGQALKLSMQMVAVVAILAVVKEG